MPATFANYNNGIVIPPGETHVIHLNNANEGSNLGIGEVEKAYLEVDEGEVLITVQQWPQAGAFAWHATAGMTRWENFGGSPRRTVPTGAKILIKNLADAPGSSSSSSSAPGDDAAVTVVLFGVPPAP